MGALISAPLSMAASCFGSCVGSCALGACCKACTCKCLTSPRTSNLLYVALILAGSGLAVGLRYGGLDLSLTTPPLGPTWMPESSLSYSICSNDNCRGYFAVYRVSFTLAVFFASMLLVTSCATATSVYAHRGFWWGKLLGIAGLLVGTLWMPNDMLAGYAWAARFVAPFFILYQMVCFIDFGYTANSLLVERDEREEALCCCENGGFKWRGLLLFLSLLLFAGAFTAVILYYTWWPGCTFNVLSTTTTLLFGLLNTGLSVSRIAQHGALFTSALMFGYSAWLCFSGLSSYPQAECNPMITSSGDHLYELSSLIASCIVAALSLGYMAYRLGSRQIGANAMNGKAAEGDHIAADQVTVHVGGGDLSESVEPESFRAYHLTMLLTVVYMAMLLTDWGTSVTDKTQRHNVGFASAWVQLIANWCCCLLYTWTLVAPACCPGRDFS